MDNDELLETIRQIQDKYCDEMPPKQCDKDCRKCWNAAIVESGLISSLPKIDNYTTEIEKERKHAHSIAKAVVDSLSKLLADNQTELILAVEAAIMAQKKDIN